MDKEHTKRLREGYQAMRDYLVKKYPERHSESKPQKKMEDFF